MYPNFNLVISLKNHVFSFTFFSASTAVSLGMQKCFFRGMSLWHILSLPWPFQSIVNCCHWHNWRKWLPSGRQNLIWCILGKNWIEENEGKFFLLNIADNRFHKVTWESIVWLNWYFFKNWSNWKLLNNILFIFFFYLICSFLLWELLLPEYVFYLFSLMNHSLSEWFA